MPDENPFIVILPFSLPLCTRIDGSRVPSAVIVTAMITRFVSFVDMQTSRVFITGDLKYFLVIHGKIDPRLVHVDDEMKHRLQLLPLTMRRMKRMKLKALLLTLVGGRCNVCVPIQ